MKAVTVIQPSATLLAIGAKRVETRSWLTHYRGPLAIHAAKGFPPAARRLCYQDPFLPVLTEARIGPGSMPRGAVIAVCTLADVIPVDRSWRNICKVAEHAAEHDDEFGDYTEGRFAWLLANVELLPEPIPARGALGLWEWDEMPAVAS